VTTISNTHIGSTDPCDINRNVAAVVYTNVIDSLLNHAAHVGSIVYQHNSPKCDIIWLTPTNNSISWF